MKQFSENYRKLLFEDFGTLNLTRISDPEEFYEKQIIDSVYPLEHYPEFKKDFEQTKLHIDVGFGGGFPLVPLAESISGMKSIGFEARRKKADAVEEIAKRLGLNDVKTYHHRIETVLIDKDATVTFKAVGKIKEFLKKVNVDQGVKVRVYFYKGPNLLELEDVPEKVGFFKKILLSEYSLPSGHIRYFVAYEAQNVPRGTKKNLVKVSELH